MKFSSILKKDSYQILFFLIFYSLLFSHISFGNHNVSQEPMEDFFNLQFYFESLIHGEIPFWTPFINNGQSFLIHSILTLYAPIDTIFGLFLHFLSKVLVFNINHVGKFVLFIYMTIFSIGMTKLLNFISDSKEIRTNFISITFALLTCLGYSNLASVGNNIHLVKLYSFFPLTFYYMILFIKKKTVRNLVGFSLCYSFFTLHAGVYCVPLSLVLITFAGAYLITEPQKHLKELLAFIRKHYLVTFFIIMLFVLSISYIIYVGIEELPRYERIGRDISKISFDDFINAHQGPPGLIRLHFFDNNLRLFLGITPFFLMNIFFFTNKAWNRKSLPLVGGALFTSTIIFMEKSPFLILYYKILFPSMVKIMYWGVIYDVLGIFYMLFAFKGFMHITSSYIGPKKLKLFFCAIIVSTFLLFISITDYFVFITFSFLLIYFLLIYITIYNKKIYLQIKLQYLFFIFVIFIGMELSTSFKHRLYDSLFDYSPIQDEQVFDTRSDAGYTFPDYRKIRDLTPLEQHGFGLAPALKSHVLIPSYTYIEFKKQLLLNKILPESEQLKKYGISKKIVYLDSNFSIVRNRDEAINILKDNPKSNVLEIYSDIERNMITKKLNSIDVDISNKSNIEILSFNPNRLDLRVKTFKHTFLYFADFFHPDWKVTINKHKSRIYPANLNFKAVFLAPGDNIVSFTFYPAKFILLYILSWVSILIMLFIFFYWKGKNKSIYKKTFQKEEKNEQRKRP